MKFVGKEKDKETGLQYFGARYMKDEIGRFITVDPVGPVDPRTSKTNYAMLANPQRLNRYAYSLNNPYRYVDPDGRMPWLLPFLYNLLLPSSANAPESKEALTAPSQTAGQFTSGVAAMEATGLVVGRIVAGARSASPALSIEGRALLEARPVASALKGDAAHRSASFMREEAARNGTHFEIVGGDGVTRTLTQVEGTLNGQTGRFEYIVEKTGNLTHQRFVPNGSINGIPNTP
ncbi:MAG: RHS repeat-associated core domain-containing protein [Nitrospirae bacterium]|nr:RHS repeat-associated core domain-containing protein [Nitrospirota bacterium]